MRRISYTAVILIAYAFLMYFLSIGIPPADVWIASSAKQGVPNIQDAFNESGVQIMSPHYMVQPERSIVIPRSKWNPSPAPSGLDSSTADKSQRVQSEE